MTGRVMRAAGIRHESGLIAGEGIDVIVVRLGGAALPREHLAPSLGDFGLEPHRPHRQRLHDDVTVPRTPEEVVLRAWGSPESKLGGGCVEDEQGLAPHLVEEQETSGEERVLSGTHSQAR